MADPAREALIDPLFNNNPIAFQVLGICSALAVTTKMDTAVVMSIAVIAVRDFMVEIGGEVRTLGKNADGEAWRIGIEKPIPGGEVDDHGLDRREARLDILRAQFFRRPSLVPRQSRHYVVCQDRHSYFGVRVARPRTPRRKPRKRDKRAPQRESNRKHSSA